MGDYAHLVCVFISKKKKGCVCVCVVVEVGV